MRDVTYISKGDPLHTATVHMPDGTPFHVEFQDGVGGHYPEPTEQKKPGKGYKREWVKGIPDEVAESWEANQQPWLQGYVIAPASEPEPKPKKAAPKKAAAKKVKK